MNHDDLTKTKESFADTMAQLQHVIDEYYQSKYFRDFKKWQAEWHRLNNEGDTNAVAEL